MKLTKEGDLLIAGIDYRKEVPVVCCMTGQMQEPEYVPMEFSRPCGKNACFRKILSTLKKYGAKEKIRAVLGTTGYVRGQYPPVYPGSLSGRI